MERDAYQLAPSPINSEEFRSSIVKNLESKIDIAVDRYQELPENQTTTIHKVSLYLDDAHNPTYFPKLVSVGPYHYHRTNLEDAKIIYFNDLKKRRSDLSSDTYVQSVQSDMTEAIGKYSSMITLSEDQFVEVMVVDSCFIIEFLIKWYLKCDESQLKQLMSKRLILKNDLLLAENQIPFFVMENIYAYFMDIPEFRKIIEDSPEFKKIIPMDHSVYPSITLVEIALTFFMGDWNEALWAARKFHEDNTKFDHLLHLYHSALNLHLLKHHEEIESFPISFFDKFVKSVVSGATRRLHNVLIRQTWSPTILNLASRIQTKWERLRAKLNTDDRRDEWLLSAIPNACYLRDKGFRFSKKYRMQYEFMDITWIGKYISIPTLHIDETTWVNFTNLMAFEQCLKTENNFTAYAVFMSNLIDGEEDVALLKECGIISNRLGTNQKVVDFFDSLCRGIFLDQKPHYLSSLFGFLGEYNGEGYYRAKFGRVDMLLRGYRDHIIFWTSTTAFLITAIQLSLSIIHFIVDKASSYR